MDSITQIALGATISAAVGFKPFGRKTLLTGALLGTLPDLDVFVDYGNAIDNFTSHRGFSHSLFVLSALSILLYFIILRLKPHCNEHKLALFLTLFLPLITHPLLDTFTTYGTQLLWPLNSPPIALHSVFVIDPLYTLPLLISGLYLAFSHHHQKALRWNKIALLVSCAYLAFGLFSQALITHRVQQDNLVKNAPTLVMPTPFNSVYWRVLSYQQDSYYEAFTYLGDNRPLQWVSYSHHRFLIADSQPDDLSRLEWFSHGWLRFDKLEDKLLITDLRLGLAGYHPFSFAVAEQHETQWKSIKPIEIQASDEKLQQAISQIKAGLKLSFWQ